MRRHIMACAAIPLAGFLVAAPARGQMTLYTFNGDSAGDEFGVSVSGAGDVNADGFADLIVGAFGDDDNGPNSGSAYLFDAAAPGKCPWDLDGTGSVGILDLLALLAVWGSDPGGPPDFDGDGTVGILDLLALLANWGPCP